MAKKPNMYESSYFRMYGRGRPTIWSTWMYPPQGVSTVKYFTEALKGHFLSRKSEYRKDWFLWALVPVFGYICVKLRHLDRDKGYPYNKNISWDKPSYMWGPPDPVEVEKRRVHKLLEAPEK